jgi:hypothetical protein
MNWDHFKPVCDTWFWIKNRSDRARRLTLLEQAKEASDMARRGICPRCKSRGKLRDNVFRCPACNQITWRFAPAGDPSS